MEKRRNGQRLNGGSQGTVVTEPGDWTRSVCSGESRIYITGQFKQETNGRQADGKEVMGGSN